MPAGTLEVLLVGAKGLNNSDFLKKMDSYVTLTCRTQEQRSTVASGQGSEPDWNETFVFIIHDTNVDTSELVLKIMDKDTFTSDDFIGEATIPLEPVLNEGSIPPTVYNVVKDQEYCGEIKVGLIFTPEGGSSWTFKEEAEESNGGRKESHYREEDSYSGQKEFSFEEEESYGGWKESSYRD